MALRVRKVTDLEGAELLLQGGIIGGVLFNDQAGGFRKIYDIDGKTFIINSPESVTVTFSTTPAIFQEGLTLAEIIDQINAALSKTIARAIRGKLALIESTISVGVTLDKDGTANTLLGFDSTADTEGQVYNAPGGGAPALVSLGITSGSDGTYILVTEET